MDQSNVIAIHSKVTPDTKASMDEIVMALGTNDSDYIRSVIVKDISKLKAAKNSPFAQFCISRYEELIDAIIDETKNVACIKDQTRHEFQKLIDSLNGDISERDKKIKELSEAKHEAEKVKNENIALESQCNSLIAEIESLRTTNEILQKRVNVLAKYENSVEEIHRMKEDFLKQTSKKDKEIAELRAKVELICELSPDLKISLNNIKKSSEESK